MLTPWLGNCGPYILFSAKVTGCGSFEGNKPVWELFSRFSFAGTKPVGDDDAIVKDDADVVDDDADARGVFAEIGSFVTISELELETSTITCSVLANAGVKDD